MRDKVTLLVGSCDAYNWLWNNFFILLKRYWKVDCEIIFVGETISTGENVNEILPGKMEWGQRMLLGLEEVKTPYTVFILEDYFLSKEINNHFLGNELTILEKHGATKVVFDQLYPPDVYQLHPIQDQLYMFDQFSLYRNTCQPAIQKTEYLKQVLKPDFTPWEYEIKGNTYSSELNEKILLNVQERIYFNFARRGGRIETGGLEFLQSQGLKL